MRRDPNTIYKVVAVIHSGRGFKAFDFFRHQLNFVKKMYSTDTIVVFYIKL